MRRKIEHIDPSLAALLVRSPAVGRWIRQQFESDQALSEDSNSDMSEPPVVGSSRQ
jgi:hypothetical protein